MGRISLTHEARAQSAVAGQISRGNFRPYATWKLGPAPHRVCTVGSSPPSRLRSRRCASANSSMTLDFPPGVVNILPGLRPCTAGAANRAHMDVDKSPLPAPPKSGSHHGRARVIRISSASHSTRRHESNIVFRRRRYGTKPPMRHLRCSSIRASAARPPHAPLFVEEKAVRRIRREKRARAKTRTVGNPFDSKKL